MSETLVFVDSQNATRERRESGEKCPRRLGEISPRAGTLRAACGIKIDMDGLCRFLTEKHPDRTAKMVSLDTGIPEKTIQRWLYEDASEPSGTNIVRLYIAYRAPFLAAALVNCPDWLNDEAVAAQNAEIDKQMEALRSQKIMGWRE